MSKHLPNCHRPGLAQRHVLATIPVELLLEIFTLAIELAAEESTEAPSFPPSPGSLRYDVDKGAETAFNIASVCRAWREIALGYPLIWSRLSFRSPAVTCVMLDRAKQSPVALHIDFHGTPRRGRGTSHFIEQYTSNVRHALQRTLPQAKELCIRGGFIHTARLLSVFNSTASALERLELTAPERTSSPVFILGARHLQTAALPMRFRRLVLECTFFEAGASVFLPAHCANLVYLELRAIQNLRVSDVLAVLSAAADTLETAIFDGPLGSAPTAAAPGPPPAPPPPAAIHLARLRHIAFTGIFSSFETSSPAMLLRDVTYPASASLVVQLHVAHISLHNAVLESVCAHLRSRLTSSAPAPQSALLSSDDAPRHPGVRLQLWARRGLPDLFNPEQHGRALLDLRVARAADAADWLTIRAISALADAARLSGVVRLAVAPLRQEVPWARLLTRAPALRELALYGPANVENLCVACTPALLFGTMINAEASADVGASAGAGAGQSATARGACHYHPHDVAGLLPALDALSVFGLPLRRGYFRERTAHFGVLRGVAEGLRRARGGRALSELVVCYCDAAATDLDELAPLVEGSNVVWDGSESGTAGVPMSMEAPPAPVLGVHEFHGGAGLGALQMPGWLVNDIAVEDWDAVEALNEDAGAEVIDLIEW